MEVFCNDFGAKTQRICINDPSIEASKHHTSYRPIFTFQNWHLKAINYVNRTIYFTYATLPFESGSSERYWEVDSRYRYSDLNLYPNGCCSEQWQLKLKCFQQSAQRSDVISLVFLRLSILMIKSSRLCCYVDALYNKLQRWRVCFVTLDPHGFDEHKTTAIFFFPLYKYILRRHWSTQYVSAVLEHISHVTSYTSFR